MKTIIAFGFVSVVMFVASAEGLAFTPSETNEVARRLIIRAKNLRDCHDIPDEGELYKPEEDPGTWYGFLGLDETNGWTVAAKIIRRGQTNPNLHVECSVDNVPLFIRIR